MSGIFCPQCDEIDQTQVVGVVVSEGTQSTVGLAGTFTGSGPMLGIAPSIYGSVTHTGLAKRLTPPTLAPGRISGATFFLGWLGLTIVVSAILNKNFFKFDGLNFVEWALLTFYMIPFGFVIAGVLIFIAHVIYDASVSKQRREWMTKFNYLNNCYYCFRDDTVYDGVDWGTPEVFVSRLFSK